MTKKILIIEDEPTILTSLENKFTQEGFIVFTATNGQQGLDVAYENHPDLILLDIVMTVMNGMATLEELRKDPGGKDVKVILLTNLSDVAKQAESLQLNVSDYIIKSDWSLEDIVKKVKSRLTSD